MKRRYAIHTLLGMSFNEDNTHSFRNRAAELYISVDVDDVVGFSDSISYKDKFRLMHLNTDVWVGTWRSGN